MKTCLIKNKEEFSLHQVLFVASTINHFFYSKLIQAWGGDELIKLIGWMCCSLYVVFQSCQRVGHLGSSREKCLTSKSKTWDTWVKPVDKKIMINCRSYQCLGVEPCSKYAEMWLLDWLLARDLCHMLLPLSLYSSGPSHNTSSFWEWRSLKFSLRGN